MSDCSRERRRSVPVANGVQQLNSRMTSIRAWNGTVARFRLIGPGLRLQSKWLVEKH